MCMCIQARMCVCECMCDWEGICAILSMHEWARERACKLANMQVCEYVSMTACARVQMCLSANVFEYECA